VNLVVLHGGEAIGEHVNQTLDVLLTCLAGEGGLHVDGKHVPLTPGTVALIPLGTRRRVVAGDSGLRYTTCHRKRGGIMPTIHRRD
jgi:quercetin dioxygenase-like cupin family protein